MKRVRKTMWKLWTGVLLFIGMIVWLPIQVWAAQTEVEIDMPEGYSKAVFYVTWENYEQPGTIVLTSPSGKVYSKKKRRIRFMRQMAKQSYMSEKEKKVHGRLR